MAGTLRKPRNHIIMKKILAILCITCALAVAAQAQDSTKKKHEPSPEAKALLDKYDTNKDGKLDKAEKAKMTPEDKESWQKASQAAKKKKQKD